MVESLITHKKEGEYRSKLQGTRTIFKNKDMSRPHGRQPVKRLFSLICAEITITIFSARRGALSIRRSRESEVNYSSGISARRIFFGGTGPAGVGL